MNFIWQNSLTVLQVKLPNKGGVNKIKWLSFYLKLEGRRICRVTRGSQWGRGGV